jgi:hypothetical protein
LRGWGGEGGGGEDKGGDRGKGGEMTQTLYAHMNKRKIKKVKKKNTELWFSKFVFWKEIT